MLTPIERETMKKDPLYDVMMDTLRKGSPEISEENLDKVARDLLELARKEGQRIKMLTDYPAIDIHNNRYYNDDYWVNLEKRFPGQDSYSFGQAVAMNSSEAQVLHGRHITSLEMIQMGSNEESNWIWTVTLDNGERFVVEGGCDYTGWDCQSWLEIRPL